MGKKLITIKTLSEMYSQGENKLYINDQVIISPGLETLPMKKA